MHRTCVLFVVAIALVPGAARAQGDPIGPEFRVNAFTTGNQGLASVAADGAANLVVVWTGGSSQDGSSYGIFGQRYAGGGSPQGPEFRVNTYTTNSQYRGVVAADFSGRFLVVWESTAQDGSGRGIFGQRYDGVGVPRGTEFRVNTYTTNDQYGPAVTASLFGGFVVLWHSNGQDGSGFGVFGQRYDASGVPLGPEFRVNSFTPGNQFYPSAGADSSGGFVVSWSSLGQDGSGYGIFGQRYASSGSPLGPEFRVNTYTTASQSVSAAASDASGDFVIVWASQNQDGSAYGIFGQRFASSGAPLGTEFRVSSYTTNTQFIPSVSADSFGNFVVVWQSAGQDGSTDGIFGQRFQSSGAPLGPEFRVNSYTTSQQVAPIVAADPSSDFVVVWNSNGQDGQGSGVFGQRFAPIVPVELMHFRVE
jgi:hypothetical protein